MCCCMYVVNASNCCIIHNSYLFACVFVGIVVVPQTKVCPTVTATKAEAATQIEAAISNQLSDIAGRLTALEHQGPGQSPLLPSTSSYPHPPFQPPQVLAAPAGGMYGASTDLVRTLLDDQLCQQRLMDRNMQLERELKLQQIQNYYAAQQENRR